MWQVDGDSSTNDTLLALASGAAGGSKISDINSEEAQQLQAALDAVSATPIVRSMLTYQSILNYVSILLTFIIDMCYVKDINHNGKLDLLV